MKKIIFGLLLLIPLQIVRGQDVQEIPKTTQLVVGVQFGGFSSLASSTNSEKIITTAMIPSSRAYYKEPKRGWNFNGDIHYMVADNFGVGAKYLFYSSGISQNFTINILSPFPEYVYVGISEREYINYTGPSAIFKQWLNDKHKFRLTETFSIGYVHYRNEMRQTLAMPNLFQPNILAKNNTWGACAGLSFDYYHLSWLSIGVNAGLMYAHLTKVDIFTQKLTRLLELDKNNFMRLDYSLGIRFHY